METHFEIQLGKLRTRLFKMCSLVDEQIQFALRAIEEEDLTLAESVIERDKKVDKYDVKIERICQKLFALNQPVAMDLRLIMSAMTINTNLERIGDIAVNIAENFISIQKLTRCPLLGRKCYAMQSIRSFKTIRNLRKK